MGSESFDIVGIPDYDQRRHGLPKDGSMYCAPTATFNDVYFMGTHGYPELLNHPLDPGNLLLKNNPYLAITWRISLMGSYDHTDPVQGGGQSGTIDYISSLSNRYFTVYSWWKSGGVPKPDAMRSWMQLGGRVTFGYGRYTNPGDSAKNRDGGHCVTMSGLTTRDGMHEVRYSDPASDETVPDLDKQSPSATTSYNLHAEYADFDGDTCVLYGLGTKPTMPPGLDPVLQWKWHRDARYSYIDSYQVIMPLLALTGVTRTGSTVAQAAAPALQLVLSAEFDNDKGYGAPTAIDLSSLIKGSLVDMALDRILPTAVVVTDASTDLVEINLAERTTRVVAKMPAPAQRLVFGGDDGSLFVLMLGRLARVDRDGQIWTIPVDPTIEAISFQDERHELLAASPTELWTFDERLRLRSKAPVALEGSGRLTLHVDQSSDEAVAYRAGQPHVHRITLDPSSTARRVAIGADEVAPATTFALAPGGQLVLNHDGVLREYGQKGVLNADSWLHDMAVGDILAFPRHMDNSTEARAHGPKWRNVVPDEWSPRAQGSPPA